MAGYLSKNKAVKIQQSQVTPVMKLEATNQIIDETADWKVYRNEEYGFEVKYPKEYRVKEEKGKNSDYFWIVISTPETEKIIEESAGELTDEIFVIPRMPASSLADELSLPEPIQPTEEYFSLNTGYGYIGSITIDQRKGFQKYITEFGLTMYTIISNPDGTWFVINGLLPFEYSKEEPYFLIVKSLKFTNKCELTPCPEEKDKTADWKNYRNKEYGLEIKYPKDWKVRETGGLVEIISPELTEVESYEVDSVTLEAKIRKWKAEAASLSWAVWDETYWDELPEIAGCYDLYELNIGKNNILAKRCWFEKCKLGFCYHRNSVFVKQKGVLLVLEITIPFIEREKELTLIERKEKYLNIFNQILSTFRFIEKDGN